MATVSSLLLSVLSYCLLFTQVDSQICREGWHYFGESCYGFGESRAVWGAAQAICERYNGKLAEIDTLEENEFLKNLAKDKQGHSKLTHLVRYGLLLSGSASRLYLEKTFAQPSSVCPIILTESPKMCDRVKVCVSSELTEPCWVGQTCLKKAAGSGRATETSYLRSLTGHPVNLMTREHCVQWESCIADKVLAFLQKTNMFSSWFVQQLMHYSLYPFIGQTFFPSSDFWACPNRRGLPPILQRHQLPMDRQCLRPGLLLHLRSSAPRPDCWLKSVQLDTRTSPPQINRGRSPTN